MRRQTGAALLSHYAIKGCLERAVSDAMGRVQREALALWRTPLSDAVRGKPGEFVRATFLRCE